MLSLVLGDVTLAAPLKPADLRPYIDKYQLTANRFLEFLGLIRVRITPITSRDRNTLTASIILASRNSTTVSKIVTSPSRFRRGTSIRYLNKEL
jgi:hypothetical protein